MVCGNFILPEPASYVFFYAFSNLRNLLYIIACGDRTGSSPGHVSDKTFYIAMNYRQKAAAANSEISEEISAKLLELERKKGRIEYYVGMLDSRKANVIRLCFFEGRTIEDAAEELNISAKTAQIAKKKAIEELTDLFALTSNIN